MEMHGKLCLPVALPRQPAGPSHASAPTCLHLKRGNDRVARLAKVPHAQQLAPVPYAPHMLVPAALLCAVHPALAQLAPQPAAGASGTHGASKRACLLLLVVHAAAAAAAASAPIWSLW